MVRTIDGSTKNDSPLHPRPDRPLFLPRLSHGQQGLVSLLAARGVRSTVAPLYYLQHNPELSLLPYRQAMGTVLDPCTQLRQKPWAERAEAFRALPFGNDAEAYVPNTARLTDDGLRDLAITPIDVQRGRGATLMLTTFHLAGAIGTRGRDVELLLAEVGIEHFRNQHIAEPPPFATVDIPREIYATLAVNIADLRSPRAREALADAYLRLGADGLWVKIAGFHERASLIAIRNAGAFLGALREAGTPIVSCGPGQLHLGLLTDDISASIGLGESERFVVPSTWAKKGKKGGPKGRTRMTYHPKYHWSFRIGSEEANRAFGQAGCECGLHAPTKPPTGHVVAQHAAVLRAEQAAEALDGEREDRREWLLASSTVASWTAADADVIDKHTSVSRYQALFDGLDAGGDDAAIGEQSEL
jgi:hypothetical protein